MKPVIFLDIDGVMNSTGSSIAFGTTRRFSDVSVGILKRIVDRVGADIVISSSWRVGSTLDELRGAFSRNGAGFLVDRIVDVTPWLSLKDRGDEVDAWLARHGLRAHVIFDDDGDFRPEQPLVRTSHNIGLSAREYFMACEIFGVPDR